jgi:Tfp pilus assembly protein PilX
MKKYIDKGLMIIMMLIVLVALIGSQYMFQQALLLERTVVNVYELNGELYECKHTPGNMECVSVNDPDIGFGRQQ